MRLSSRATLGLLSAASMVCMVAIAPSRAAEPDGPAALIGPAEALRIAIVTRVADKGAKAGSEFKALADYYSAPDAHVLWVDENGLNLRAKSVMEEIGNADDYGLRASDYALPRIEGFNAKSPNASGALADAEVKLDLAVLRYARDARGGRFDWTRIDPNLDPTLALPDPLQVMESMAIRAEPAVYLRSFQPDQPQFEALRKALIAARGGHVDDGVVRIPDGPVLKLGVEHEQVALLRKRLEVPATDGAKETVFDAGVEQAVRRFQEERGYRPDGLVGPGTRRVLNGEQQRSSSPARTRIILLNMERWRWLPNDLGPFYVTVNIPEFTLRVMDEGKPEFTTRVVVGKPDKQTPVFSNEMQEVVFNPYWNVPNSIKMEELLPSIRGGGDWFFGGGGGGWDTSVFARNGLRVAIGTKEVDPSMLDWNRIDIRSLNVYQPPGPDNVLGTIKFLFPNKHDVYMHDTTQKNLFAKTVRAESHGCMRVQNPDQLATALLNKDQGWSAQKVASAIQSGVEDQHIGLKQKIPVYITYFTLKVDDDGSATTFNDVYGHDARMASVMFGEPMAYDPFPPMVEEVAAPVERMPQVRAQQQQQQRRRGRPPSNSIADTLSGFLNN
ncbi:L,D-transpeptidase family protein [Methyloceanibacter sp.]|uniref:L,D-transpeptidase family protein n=1 Tax=Methyloceanibacter sp. TaxID=1965321 RepID=UPI003D6C90AD